MVRNLSGGTHHMGINLLADNPTRRTDAFDEGNYTSYAGPARVWGTPHECISFAVGHDGHSHKEWWVHCG